MCAPRHIPTRSGSPSISAGHFAGEKTQRITLNFYVQRSLGWSTAQSKRIAFTRIEPRKSDLPRISEDTAISPLSARGNSTRSKALEIDRPSQRGFGSKLETVSNLRGTKPCGTRESVRASTAPASRILPSTNRRARHTGWDYAAAALLWASSLGRRLRSCLPEFHPGLAVALPVHWFG